MSRQVDPVMVEYFDGEVKRSYGDKRVLAGKVYEKFNVVGKTAYFQKKGKGLATKHNAGSEVTYMNTAFSRVPCDLQDWEAFDSADKFDSKKINFNEVTELAEVAGDAIGLRMDQVILDAMATGRDTGEDVGTGTTTLTIATLLKGTKKFNKNGIDKKDRILLHSADQLEDLLKTTEPTSSDFSPVQSLYRGDIDYFCGLQFIMIADRQEGGLPHTAGSVTGLMYHKRAVGYAQGMGMETEMTWIPKERAYMVGAEFSAGACVIDQQGVIGVTSKVTA